MRIPASRAAAAAAASCTEVAHCSHRWNAISAAPSSAKRATASEPASRHSSGQPRQPAPCPSPAIRSEIASKTAWRRRASPPRITNASVGRDRPLVRAEGRPVVDGPQCGELGAHDGRVVDEVAHRRGRGHRGPSGARQGVGGDVDGVEEPPIGGGERAAPIRLAEEERVQRVDPEEVGPGRAEHPRQVREVAQVADPPVGPRGRRAQLVELAEHPPGRGLAEPVRQVAGFALAAHLEPIEDTAQRRVGHGAVAVARRHAVAPGERAQAHPAASPRSSR